MVDMIKAKIASGEYADESEVVADGLRELKARDDAIDRWLRDEVVASWDEYKADPSMGIPADEVSARLDARMKARLANSKAE
jgi:Arc/MetJ-type ribon-helix-helix transcriptional regulator